MVNGYYILIGTVSIIGGGITCFILFTFLDVFSSKDEENAEEEKEEVTEDLPEDTMIIVFGPTDVSVYIDPRIEHSQVMLFVHKLKSKLFSFILRYFSGLYVVIYDTKRESVHNLKKMTLK